MNSGKELKMEFIKEVDADLVERYNLVIERIRSIKDDNTVPEQYREFAVSLSDSDNKCPEKSGHFFYI